MPNRISVAWGLCIVAVTAAGAGSAPAADLKTATSRITAVTVYQSNALVTREVTVPEGAGSMEIVVTPLPGQTVQSSLYSEGTDGVRVLSTRFRTRVVREDTREEVRKLEAELKRLRIDGQKLAAEIKTLEADRASVNKLENFTSATLSTITEKGRLDSAEAIKLMEFVLAQRQKQEAALLELQLKVQANNEAVEFVERQLRQVAGRGGKTEHDAVILLDKKNAPEAKLRLNYLVTSASWRPTYKLRAGKDKDPVALEYLAGLTQNTGEDWAGAIITLSNAQPALNAAPPELKGLEVSLVRLTPGQVAAGPANPGAPAVQLNILSFDRGRNKAQRDEAQSYANTGKAKEADKLFNDAAADEQAADLLAFRDGKDEKAGPPAPPAGDAEGPSVTYRLPGPLTIPSRNDEQVVEIARVELTPSFYYKAVPVLTRHVYRLADLTNKSTFVLLPGEAGMYIGTDFVGRMQLPLVAVGETFTAGFGVEPQLQVTRKQVDKSRTLQGGNQVLSYEYRLLISSYKAEPVRLQLWDRLPTAEAQAVAVTLVQATPDLSKDPLYLREERPRNLLRWDLTVEPASHGEKAVAVTYKFRMELDRNMAVGGVMSK
jgi:hypothetical protein